MHWLSSQPPEENKKPLGSLPRRLIDIFNASANHKYTELSFCIRRVKSGRRSHIGEICSQMPCVKHPGFHPLSRRKGSGKIGSGSFHEPSSST